MKKLKIEWMHLDVKGETCDRCYDTGENLTAEVKRLSRALQKYNIEVEYVETKLDKTQIPQSNKILFNDVPIENILDIKVAENFCDSCSELLGDVTYCRTIEFDGNEYEEIPAKAIRQAAYKVLDLDVNKSAQAEKSEQSEKTEKTEKPEKTKCGCGCDSCC